MSYWTHITGTITVSPMGRTQAEKRYILETVLNHLPLVTGSEEDMHIYIIQKAGANCSSSCDEFGMSTNNLKDKCGDHSRRGWMEIQEDYILVVEGDFRDRLFNQTYKEFIKWLCRLSKRVIVGEVFVSFDSDDKGHHIIDYYDNYICNPFYDMFESPSWSRYKNDESTEPNWCEYLMWERHKDCYMPAQLVYKYYDDKENDKRVEAWCGYNK